MPRSALFRATFLIPVLLALVSLSACGQSNSTSVSLHGVNYSGDAFRYYVADAEKPGEFSGGEMVEPFGAGGTMCCATLPKKWRPGIKLQVRTVRWVKRQGDGDAEEIQEEHSVEVPPYVDGKVGELWVVRDQDGSVGAVSSEYQPDHPKWPGKVKGWPVPSIEYRRERWAIHLRHQEMYVSTFVELLDELEKDPVGRTRDAWAFSSKHSAEELKGFTGPDDPKFAVFLQSEYEQGLMESRRSVRELMESRP